MIMKDIENIDAWLVSNRRINRISYMKMCNVIGYSDTGFKSALTNNILPMPSCVGNYRKVRVGG
jgi:hypothetical protein